MKRKLSTWLLTSFLLLSSLVLIQPTLAAPVMADDTILSGQGDHLQSFAAREYILYLVTEEGNLLATGNQSYNALLENDANYSGGNTVSPFDMTNRLGLDPADRVDQVFTTAANTFIRTTRGRILAWGVNDYGQIGNGSTTSDAFSVPATDITDAFALAPSDEIITITGPMENSGSILALSKYGRLYTWGKKEWNLLEPNSVATVTTPTERTSAFPLAEGEIIDTAWLGNGAGYAKTSFGNVYSWGRDDNYGSLGSGTIVQSVNPQNITDHFGLQPEETIENLFGGSNYAFATTSMGRIFSWGYGGYGILANNSTSSRVNVPTDVTENFDLESNEIIDSMNLTSTTATAITSENRVLVWGNNNYNQGIYPSSPPSNIMLPLDISPRLPTLEENEVVVQAGIISTGYALTNEGRLFQWGYNPSSFLSNDIPSMKQAYDITALFDNLARPIISNIVKMVFTKNPNSIPSVLYLNDKGMAFFSGTMQHSQIYRAEGTAGPYQTGRLNSLMNLAPGERVRDIAASGNAFYLVTTEGRVFSVGMLANGLLGNGMSDTFNYYLTPIDITSFFNFGEYETAMEVYAGAQHVFVTTSSFRVFGWGVNQSGQLGLPSLTTYMTPQDLTSSLGLASGEIITSIAPLDDAGTIMLTSQNRILTFGYYGLADNSTTARSTPTDVTANFALAPGETFTLVEGGYHTAFAVTNQGRVFGWGENDVGQVGNNTTQNPKRLPVDITSFFGFNPNETIYSIESAQYRTYAISSEGRIFAWGYDNYYGLVYAQSYHVPTDITSAFSLHPGETPFEIEFSSTAILITDHNRYFGWGRNLADILGFHPDYDVVATDSSLAISTPELFFGVVDAFPYHVANIYVDEFTPPDADSITATIQFTHGILDLVNTIYINDVAYDMSELIHSDNSILFTIPNEYELGDTVDFTVDAVQTDTMFAYPTGGNWRQTTIGYPTHSIYFQSNGGSDVEAIQAPENDVVLAPDIPIKTGYQFQGWYATSALTGDPYTFTVMPSSDLLLYAKWTPNQHEVTYLDEGGATLQTSSHDYASNLSTITAPTVPAKTGYTFTGWNVSLPSTMPDHDIELTPVYSINQYTLSFEENEGDPVSNLTQDYNSSVILPTPTRTGYTFLGWYEEASFTTHYQAMTMPAMNRTLYAKWQINQYIITFEENGGTELENLTLDYFASISLPTPIQLGYTFLGWYEENEFLTSFVFDNMPAHDQTIYAKWRINQYTLSFEENEGSTQTDITQDYHSAITLPTPTRIGYTFVGWYEESMFTTLFEATWMPASSHTLYAKWDHVTYHISFESNGGSSVTSLGGYHGTSVSSPTPPTRALHTFMGWYRDSALTQAYSFTSMPAESLTLYAKWNENRIQGVHADDVSLSYDGQSHTLTVTGMQPGDTLTYALQETGLYTNAKPRFAVASALPYTIWYKVTRNDYYDFIDSMTITIQGTQHQVTFETNGGSTITPLENVYQGSSLSLPTPPTKANQVFIAWYRDQALTQGWNVERDVITSDITLYARYAATTHALGGIVSNQASAPVANATLHIYSGNALLASTMTNAQGEYSFDALPEGNYNVQIVIDNDIYQRFVQVPAGGNLAAHFAGLEQHFSLVLELYSSSPDIVIDGLEPLSNSTSSLITSQDQALVTSGGSIRFTINIEGKQAIDLPVSLANTLEESGKTLGLALEIQIIKTTETSGGDVETSIISELDSLVTIYIPLQSSLQGKRDYVVYRFHNASIDTLTTSANIYGESIEVFNDHLLVHARNFSDYVIGYSEPQTSSWWWLWILLVLLAGGLGYVIYCQQKRKETDAVEPSKND